jgi:YVTN family beta-propeller protein
MATANGSFIYVGDLNLSHIYKIATASQTIVATIVMPGPLTTTVGFAVDATNGHVYFGDAGSGNVYVINISTNALTTIVSGTTPNRGVKVNDNPTFAYLQGATQAEDLLTNATPTSVTPISTTPRGAGFGAVSPNGQRLFVGDIGGGTVTVIDTSTNTVNSQIAHAGTSVAFVTAQYFPGGIPPTPTAISVPPLFIPHKVPQTPDEWNADWVTLETWSSWVGQLGKAPLFIPRKGSDLPMDLTTNWLAIENWANSL